MSSDFPTPACLHAVGLIGAVVTDGHHVGRVVQIDGPDWQVTPDPSDTRLPNQRAAKITRFPWITFPYGPVADVQTCCGLRAMDVSKITRGVTLAKHTDH